MKKILINNNEKLLLTAALSNNNKKIINSWKKWNSKNSIEAASNTELRILPSVYTNLSRFLPSKILPLKLKGQIFHNYLKNKLSLDCALKLAKLFANKKIHIIFGKGLNICQRFNSYTTRLMSDIDFYIKSEDLNNACILLKKLGWTPDEGMTWESIIRRSLIRKSSMNLQKTIKGIKMHIDMHWKSSASTNKKIYKQKLIQADAIKIKEQIIFFENPEFAVLNCIEHAIYTGNETDQAQMILDLEKLLPTIDEKKLFSLLSDSVYLKVNIKTQYIFNYIKYFFRSINSKVFVPDIKINFWRSQLNKVINKFDVTAINFNTSKLLTILYKLKIILFTQTEKSLLRYPAIYFIWQLTNFNSTIEKIILRLLGPMSLLDENKKEYKTLYLPYKCKEMDKIGGPGWAFPINKPHKCFWGDRHDSRILIYLKERKTHKLTIYLTKMFEYQLYYDINIYVNGYFLGKISNNMKYKTNLIIEKEMVSHKKFIEISFRSNRFNDNLTFPLKKIKIHPYYATNY